MAEPPEGRVPAIHVGKQDSNSPKMNGWKRHNPNKRALQQPRGWPELRPAMTKEGMRADAAFRRGVSAVCDSRS
jgi:hypothetical protein